jgi:hypothetical protein
VCIIHRSPCCVWPGMASSAAELFVCRYYLRLLRLRHHYKYRVVAGTSIVCWVMHAWMAFPTPATLSLPLSHRISAAAALTPTYHLAGWTPATSEFQARFSPQIPPSSTPPPPPPVSKP